MSGWIARVKQFALNRETQAGSLLLGGYFLSRLINLTLLPLFVDEGVYLWWGISVLQGNLQRGFGEGKPLVGWAIALAIALGADYAAAPRLAQALLCSLTLIGILLLTAHYLSKRAALVAALLWIVLPYPLFFERLSTPDAVMAAFGTLVIYLSVRMTTDKRWYIPLAAGIGMIAAVLAKSPVGLFFAIAPLAAVLLLQPARAWRGQARPLAICYALFGVFFALAALMVIRRIRLGLNPPGFGLHEIFAKTSLGLSNDDFIGIVGRNLGLLVSWLGLYLTWPLAAALLASWLAAWFKSPLLRLLALLSGLYVLIFVLTSDIITPRYFFPALPLLVILLAWGLTGALDAAAGWLRGRLPRWRPVALSGLLVGLTALVVLALVAPSSLPLLFHPQAAPAEIRAGCVEEVTSGYGFQEAATYLDQAIAASGETAQVVTLHVSDHARLLAYAPPTLRPMLRQVHIVDGVNRSPAEQPAILQSWLPDAVNTYVLAGFQPWDAAFSQAFPQAALVRSFPRPGGETAVKVYLIRATR
jgi:hypothetical protein